MNIEPAAAAAGILRMSREDTQAWMQRYGVRINSEAVAGPDGFWQEWKSAVRIVRGMWRLRRMAPESIGDGMIVKWVHDNTRPQVPDLNIFFVGMMCRFAKAQQKASPERTLAFSICQSCPVKVLMLADRHNKLSCTISSHMAGAIHLRMQTLRQVANLVRERPELLQQYPYPREEPLHYIAG